jgi:hypothetical protein
MIYARIFLIALFLPWGGYAGVNDTKTLLIVGCARSGTFYMSTLLQRSGIDIQHEKMGKQGTIAWPMTVGSLSVKGPLFYGRFKHIFHQVRHPLRQITSRSIQNSDLGDPRWIFVREHIPEIRKTDSILVSCAKYWYYWNLKAEKIAQWRYRIEDIDQIVDEFEARSGLLIHRAVLKTLPRDINTRKETKAARTITWKKLKKEIPRDLYQNIQNMARRYGYPTEDLAL